MKHIAAYALLVLGGNPNPTAADVEALLTACGATCDKQNVETCINSIAGRPLPEVMAEGLAKMNTSTVASGSVTQAVAESSTVNDAGKVGGAESEDEALDGLEGGLNLFDDEDY